MAFNPTVLKNFFRKISRSGMADDVAKAVTKSGTPAPMPSTGATLQQLFKNSNPNAVGKLYGEDLLTPSRAAFMDAIDGTPKFKASGVGFDNKPLGLIDIPDDIPKTMSLDDLVLDNAWRKTHNVNKAPMTSDEFVNNYKAHRNATRNSARETKELLDAFPNSYANAPTELDLLMQGDDYLKQASPEPFGFVDSAPDYEAMNVNPTKFDQRKDLIGSMDFPDGFTHPDDFAKYYDALERGYTLNTDVETPYYYTTNPSLLEHKWRKGRDAMTAGTLLSMHDSLHMPKSDATQAYSQMLAKKYIHPDNAQAYSPLSKDRMSELYNKLVNS